MPTEKPQSFDDRRNSAYKVRQAKIATARKAMSDLNKTANSHEDFAAAQKAFDAADEAARTEYTKTIAQIDREEKGRR